MSYGNGINVASGFDLGAKLPLDSRNVAETIVERDENVINNRAYDGMIVYVKENNTTYQYVNNEWIIFGSNNDVENVYTKEEIDEIKKILEEKDLELSQKIQEINDYLASGGGSSGGGVNIYIGENPPIDKTSIWIDSSTPYNLNPNNYDDRLRSNYTTMLNNSYNKVSNVEDGLTLLQTTIDNITDSDNQEKASELRITISTMIDDASLLKDKLTSVKMLIINKNELSELKTEAKNIRKEVKKFIYSLYDIKNEILRIIDSERITINQEEPIPPTTTDSSSILTEDGLILLTEDGLLLLADGVGSSTFTNAILTELGINILTEDGTILLADGNSSEILTDAILTELGLSLLTEDDRQILKG